jgi:hypothetical protein
MPFSGDPNPHKVSTVARPFPEKILILIIQKFVACLEPFVYYVSI